MKISEKFLTEKTFTFLSVLELIGPKEAVFEVLTSHEPVSANIFLEL